MNHYFYKLIAPRPTFPGDMTPAEGAVMEAHMEYWRELLGTGKVVVYGPVADPAGTFGMAVVAADTDADVRAIGAGDPAVVGGVCDFAVFDMPATILPAR